MHALTLVALASLITAAVSVPLAVWVYNSPRSKVSTDAEEVLVGTAIGACVVLFFSGIFAYVGYARHEECETYAQEAGVDFRYGWNADCRLELDDRFVPEDNWRVTERRGS